MTAQESIVYSVSTRAGGAWTARGQVIDMQKAIGAAEGFLAQPDCERVRVDKTFYDAENARQVTTTILEKGRDAPRARRGPGIVTWVLVAAAGGVISFALTYAVATGAFG